MSREDIINHMLVLLDMSVFAIENDVKVRDILENAKNNSFDLSDLLIACRCEVEKNTPIMTFDKKASKFAWFELID